MDGRIWVVDVVNDGSAQATWSLAARSPSTRRSAAAAIAGNNNGNSYSSLAINKRIIYSCPGLEKFNDVTECFHGKYRGPLSPRYFLLKHEVTSLNYSPGQEVISHTCVDVMSLILTSSV